MFCVNCGTKLENDWIACPNCGTKNIANSEDSKDTKAIVIETSPKGEAENEEKKVESISQRFHFEGFRRTNRFGFKYYASEVELADDKVQVVIHKKKDMEAVFNKSDIAEIKFPLIPIMRGLDIFLILLFVVLSFFTKGLCIFATLFFVKLTLVKHMQIKLKDGRKIAIPIRQAAETIEFLEAIDYPQNQIEKIAASAVSDKTIIIHEWIVSGIMFVIAAVTIGIASNQMSTGQMNIGSDESEQIQIDDTIRTMEEVSGYEAWVESEYASRVRTDIVVTLPISEREAEDYAVQIGTSLGDIVYIKQSDGAMATEWEWLLNAVPDIDGGDTATFQATLTLDGYKAKDGEKVIPVFVAEDIESYYEHEENNNNGQEETEEVLENNAKPIDIDYEYLYGGVMDGIIGELSEKGFSPEGLQYAFYDIDKDGYLDFIMENGTCNADMKLEVYSTKDGEITYKAGETYYIGSLYECREGNGFYINYGHMDYETVVHIYIEDYQLKEKVIHDIDHTLENGYVYGYVNGVAIEELKYLMEVNQLEGY